MFCVLISVQKSVKSRERFHKTLYASLEIRVSLKNYIANK